MNAMGVAQDKRLLAAQERAETALAGRKISEFAALYLIFHNRGYTKAEFKVWLTQPCGYLHGMLPMRVWDEGDKDSMLETVARIYG